MTTRRSVAVDRPLHQMADGQTSYVETAPSGSGFGQALDRVRGGMAPPKGVDTAAINAVLIGAVHHLVLSGEVQGRSGQLSLKTGKDWDKAAQAVRRLVRGVYP